jgi:hypothetical protein
MRTTSISFGHKFRRGYKFFRDAKIIHYDLNTINANPRLTSVQLSGCPLIALHNITSNDAEVGNVRTKSNYTAPGG